MMNNSRKVNFNESRFKLVILILILGLVFSIVLSISLGTMSISPFDLIKTLLGNGTSSQNIALFTIRIPRIAIAVLVGGALAVSGAILQSVTNNNLAEPGILGITTGSALFVIIYIYMTNGKNYYGITPFTIYTMPVIALLGGVFAAAIIYILAWKKGINSTRLLLMGIAINSGFSAIIIIAQLRFEIKDFNKILMWTSGSIWGSSWSYVFAVTPIILFFICLSFYKSRYLDLFNLGDETSIGLGVNVENERLILIAIAVALAGAATSVAGSVSFVGLMSPHIARKLTGPKHKYLVISSMFIGMILVVVSDTIARNLFAPIELHLGIVVSIIGVPYFIYLMIKE